MTQLFKEFNTKQYASFVMFDFPIILKMDDVSPFYGYLYRNNTEKEDDSEQYCSI